MVITLPFLLLLAYYLVSRVWTPLTAEVELPPGVTEQNPSLQSELFDTIDDQQSARVYSLPAEFAVGPLFRDTPTP